MSSHLRLVVDNTDPNLDKVLDRDFVQDNADVIMDLLGGQEEVNVVKTWQHCIELPVSSEEDKYNQFMARNWHHFSSLLAQAQHGDDAQAKHRKANYFMMKVYLAVMNAKAIPEASISVLKGPYKPGQLDFWVNRFALKIINNENKRAESDLNPSPNDFGGRVKRIIESA